MDDDIAGDDNILACASYFLVLGDGSDILPCFAFLGFKATFSGLYKLSRPLG